jgi:hypothetical protein
LPNLLLRDDAEGEEYPIGAWIEDAIASAPNRQRLQRQLDSIASNEMLLSFLHRFVLFNDALAARVPYLAGLIHLTPNLFLDPTTGVDFCRQANGRIAAFVAEAASDEYEMSDGRNMVHQYLSQRFFRGALAYFGADERLFDQRHPVLPVLSALLEEARGKFFDRKGAAQIFCGLGFHVGLEFFAHQEFNLVDVYLRSKFPDLVARLERDDRDRASYLWLALHTIVEIGHYRAGLEALKAAVTYYSDRGGKPAMIARTKEGFNAFVDLQGRYYEAILSDVR